MDYCPWLRRYEDTILPLSKGVPILDLGSGYGDDTLFLLQRGYEVISCDISREALEGLASRIPDAVTMQLDMRAGLPFPDASTRLIIANLSLHYFRWNDTMRIIKEIDRVLVDGGHLMCRLNSVRDVNHGAGQGIPMERFYFNVNGKLKRFFDREHVQELFENWEMLHREEYSIMRQGREKVLWEVVVRKR